MAFPLAKAKEEFISPFYSVRESQNKLIINAIRVNARYYCSYNELNIALTFSDVFCFLHFILSFFREWSEARNETKAIKKFVR